MNNTGTRKYKNSKYTRELSRILLIRFPPMWNIKNSMYQCYGLTGNFLPIVVKINSKRKFSKLQGWYWTKYVVSNKFAKISERMKLYKVDEEMIKRLWIRLKTVEISEYSLNKVLNNGSNSIEYITVIDSRKFNLYLFYLNNSRKKLLKNVDSVKVKIFKFRRFGKVLTNYVTDSSGVLKILFSKKSQGEGNEENKQGYEEE